MRYDAVFQRIQVETLSAAMVNSILTFDCCLEGHINLSNEYRLLVSGLVVLMCGVVLSIL